MKKNPKIDRRVLACIPYYKCQKYIRRAVESLLAQTHREITIVVINDGDHNTPPWPMLEDINDPRLLRFDLLHNHGPYFVLQLALMAFDIPFFLVQDADDESHHRRVELLIEGMEQQDALFAFSAQQQYCKNREGKYKPTEIRWEKNCTVGGKDNENFVVDFNLDEHFKYRVPHMGLFRSRHLKQIGGYFGGFLIGFDTLVTNLILMTGRIAHINFPLYKRYIRDESLTHSKETGYKSAYASEVKGRISALYEESYAVFRKFLSGQIPGKALFKSLQLIATRYVTDKEREDLSNEVLRMRKHIMAGIGFEG
jgi:glycosyltransferase involved in cell wall biosynthesis